MVPGPGRLGSPFICIQDPPDRFKVVRAKFIISFGGHNPGPDLEKPSLQNSDPHGTCI